MTHPIAKALCLACGLVGGGTFSQYPEFAQQYVQRLAGQVDVLDRVTADFDASALAANLTRTQALDQMTGTPFLEARHADMQHTFARHTVLAATLTELRNASAVARISMIHRLTDRQTLQNTWADFRPAIPVTTAGAITGSVGFLGGWILMTAVLALLKLPFRRRKVPPSAAPRRDPPVQRPVSQTFQTPRLMGETRP